MSSSTRIHWCTEFLESLREEGFRITIGHHLRAERLLNEVGPTATTAQLKTILCPVIATSRDEQRKFYDAFDRYFLTLQSEDVSPQLRRQIRESARQTGSTPGLLAVDPPKDRWRHFRIPPGRAVVWGILLTVSIAWLATSLETSSVVPPHDPIVDTPTGADPADTMPRLLPRLPPPAVAPTAAHVAESDWLRTAGRYAGVALPLLLVAGYHLNRHRRGKAAATRERRRDPPYVWPVKTPEGAAFGPYFTDEFHWTARILRRRQRSNELRLSVERSLTATVASGGYPTLLFESGTRPPEYLMLIERKTARDHQARLFETFADTLRSEGAYVVRYYYEHDPRLCFADGTTAGTRLSELWHNYSDHRLLIYSTGKGLLDGVTGRLQQWTDVLAEWPDRALLTPASPASWGAREIELARLMPVMPATLEGVRAVVDYFEDTGGATRPVPRERVVAAEPIDRDSAFVTADQLREYLGADAFRWLCACAVYSELHWDLTLFLGTLPEVGTGLLTETNLLRFARLRWFRDGAMPDALRLQLLEELSAMDREDGRQTESAVRRALLTAFEQAPEEIKNSVAGDRHEVEALLNRLYLCKDDPGEHRKVLRQLEQRVPHKQLLRDVTVVRLLRSLKIPRLALALPERIRAALFPGATPRLGARMRLTLPLALALSALAWRTFDVPATIEWAPTDVARLVFPIEEIVVAPGFRQPLMPVAFDSNGAQTSPSGSIALTVRAGQSMVIAEDGSVQAVAPGTSSVVATSSGGTISEELKIDVSANSTFRGAVWRSVPRIAQLEISGRIESELPGLPMTWTSCSSDVVDIGEGRIVLPMNVGSATIVGKSSPNLGDYTQTTVLYVNDGLLPIAARASSLLRSRPPGPPILSGEVRVHLDAVVDSLRARPELLLMVRAVVAQGGQQRDAQVMATIVQSYFEAQGLGDRAMMGEIHVERCRIAGLLPGVPGIRVDLIPQLAADSGEYLGTGDIAGTGEFSDDPIQLEPNAVRLTVGDSIRLRVTGGVPAASSRARWSSSDPSRAAVSSAGLVRGIAAGRATIVAIVDEDTVRASVTVEDRTTPYSTYEGEWREEAGDTWRFWLSLDRSPTPAPLYTGYFVWELIDAGNREDLRSQVKRRGTERVTGQFFERGDSLTLRGIRTSDASLVSLGAYHLVFSTDRRRITGTGAPQDNPSQRGRLSGSYSATRVSPTPDVAPATAEPSAPPNQANVPANRDTTDRPNPPPCGPLVFDLENGRINGVAPTANQAEVKGELPCWTGSTPESDPVANYGGGVFFLNHDFYLYTAHDRIEARSRFDGTMRPPLLGASLSTVMERIGRPQLLLPQRIDSITVDTLLYYDRKYGCLELDLAHGRIEQVNASARSCAARRSQRGLGATAR